MVQELAPNQIIFKCGSKKCNRNLLFGNQFSFLWFSFFWVWLYPVLSIHFTLSPCGGKKKKEKKVVFLLPKTLAAASLSS